MSVIRRALLQEWQELKEKGEEPGFIQLDLEAEIERIKNNQKMEPISAKEVTRLINEEGYHRYQKDNEDGVGSIQEHFKLTGAQVKELFSHPALKGLRKVPPKLKIIDDLDKPKESADENEGPNSGDGPNARLGTPGRNSTDTISSTASELQGDIAKDIETTERVPVTSTGNSTEELFK